MRRLGFYGIATPDGDLYEDEVCVWGGDEHGKRDAASVCDHLNDEIAEDAPVKYRVVPLFWESEDAWQPIETAPRDGSVFILGWPGGRAPGFWCQSFGRFSALPGSAELPPGKMQGFYPFDEWTHWQPLPAPPKEKES